MNIKPLHDRVIIKPNAVEEKTLGGIIIPDTAKEKPQKGTIVAVGFGKGGFVTDSDKVNLISKEPLTVQVGDIVLYGKYAGTEIEVDGQVLLIMRESEILAII